jgi:hypothetical protein
MESPSDKPGSEKENRAHADRRTFIKGAAGVLGAVAISPALSQSAHAAAQTAGSEDPKLPPGLKRPAMLSSKYTVTYEKSVPAAMAVMTDYFAALSRRDLKGISNSLHFPHATYESTDATIVASPEELMDTPPPSMNVTGKGEHIIEPGAYDVLESLNLHIYNPIRVGLSLSYSRFEPSGHKILQNDGIYWVTNNDGKWAIELASTIVTPADQVGVPYNDGTEAFLRHERDAWLIYLLNDRTANANNVPMFGTHATIPIVTGPDLFDAREGDPMARYKVEGVKSRLVVTEVPVTAPPPLRMDPSPVPNGYPDSSLYNGGGEGVGQYRASMVLPNARVLHASLNKVHALTGLVRYTDKWKRILELRYINIYVYKRGRWGSAGGGDPDHFLDYSDPADNIAS